MANRLTAWLGHQPCYPFSTMRPLIFSALSLVALLPVFGQSTASPKAGFPKNPHAVLAGAAPFYNFSSPKLRPWHLKATYQLFDSKGAPTEQGTWDYWWASAKVHRSRWTRAGTERSDWWTAKGAHYYKQSGPPLHFFERTIQSILLSPLPSIQLLDSRKAKLDLKMLPPHKPKLTCVIVTPQRLLHHKVKAPIPDLTSDYCFEPPTMALRYVYRDRLTILYGQLVETQGRYLARQVVVKLGRQTLFSVSVDTVESLNSTDTEFSPSPDATLQKWGIELSPDSIGGATDDHLVKKAMPVYPLFARMGHQQGVVVLADVIGTDGRVDDLEVLASPSPMLAQSAVSAVKKWVYRPYLRHGQPVEVDAIVNVVYTLGR